MSYPYISHLLQAYVDSPQERQADFKAILHLAKLLKELQGLRVDIFDSKMKLDSPSNSEYELRSLYKDCIEASEKRLKELQSDIPALFSALKNLFQSIPPSDEVTELKGLIRSNELIGENEALFELAMAFLVCERYFRMYQIQFLAILTDVPNASIETQEDLSDLEQQRQLAHEQIRIVHRNLDTLEKVSHFPKTWKVHDKQLPLEIEPFRNEINHIIHALKQEGLSPQQTQWLVICLMRELNRATPLLFEEKTPPGRESDIFSYLPMTLIRFEHIDVLMRAVNTLMTYKDLWEGEDSPLKEVGFILGAFLGRFASFFSQSINPETRPIFEPLLKFLRANTKHALWMNSKLIPFLDSCKYERYQPVRYGSSVPVTDFIVYCETLSFVSSLPEVLEGMTHGYMNEGEREHFSYARAISLGLKPSSEVQCDERPIPNISSSTA